MVGYWLSNTGMSIRDYSLFTLLCVPSFVPYLGTTQFIIPIFRVVRVSGGYFNFILVMGGFVRERCQHLADVAWD